MKILKFLLYLVLGLGVLWAVLGLFGKKDYHIERSIEIDAPKNLVYDQVVHFKNFAAWSPWAKLDANMKTSIEGADGTVGTVYKWAGNDDVGSGQETITALSPDRIDLEIKFIEPFESTSPVYFLFEEKGAKTKVTWAFDMHIAFPWNGLAMFTDMDAGVGKDYTQGLENLKQVCEAIAHKKYRGYEVAVEEIPERFYVGVRKTVAFADMTQFFGTTFSKAMEQIQKGGASPAGAPAGLFWNFDEQAGKADMAAAMPVAASQKFGGGMSVFPVGGKSALVINYLGAYEKSGEAHYAMDEYMTEKGLQNVPPVIEEYITDPGQEPDTSKWLTRVIYFVEPKMAATAQDSLPGKQ